MSETLAPVSTEETTKVVRFNKKYLAYAGAAVAAVAAVFYISSKLNSEESFEDADA